jgi:hypothetical protein
LPITHLFSTKHFFATEYSSLTNRHNPAPPFEETQRDATHYAPTRHAAPRAIRRSIIEHPSSAGDDRSAILSESVF